MGRDSGSSDTTATDPARRARPGKRAPVTRELLITRALAIIDADGLDALTMRRLAADVGVEAASLYHHVSGRQELVDGALALVRSEMVFREPLPTHWADLFEVVFLRYLEVLMAHPHFLPLAGRHLDTDQGDGLPFLVASGLSEADAVALWQSVMAFVVGFAVFATEAFPRDADYLPAGLAVRMTHWPLETAQRTVQELIRAYTPRRRPVRARGTTGG